MSGKGSLPDRGSYEHGRRPDDRRLASNAHQRRRAQLPRCGVCGRWRRVDHRCPPTFAHVGRPALTPARFREMHP